MAFDIGETVICSCEVKDDAGAYKDPATSMKITVIDKSGIVKVDGVVMTKDAVGKYHYDFATLNMAEGVYVVRYEATDGTRITIEKDTFSLV